jgi:hypothetical protein
MILGDHDEELIEDRSLSRIYCPILTYSRPQLRMIKDYFQLEEFIADNSPETP